MPNPQREPEERTMWLAAWVSALSHMPRRMGDKCGSPSVLRSLLGYKVKDLNGRNTASQHFHSAMSRGQKPRDPYRAKLLLMLAGPYGTTIARALAARRGLDLSKYPKWP